MSMHSHKLQTANQSKLSSFVASRVSPFPATPQNENSKSQLSHHSLQTSNLNMTSSNFVISMGKSKKLLQSAAYIQNIQKEMRQEKPQIQTMFGGGNSDSNSEVEKNSLNHHELGDQDIGSFKDKSVHEMSQKDRQLQIKEEQKRQFMAEWGLGGSDDDEEDSYEREEKEIKKSIAARSMLSHKDHPRRQQLQQTGYNQDKSSISIGVPTPKKSHTHIHSNSSSHQNNPSQTKSPRSQAVQLAITQTITPLPMLALYKREKYYQQQTKPVQNRYGGFDFDESPDLTRIVPKHGRVHHDQHHCKTNNNNNSTPHHDVALQSLSQIAADQVSSLDRFVNTTSNFSQLILHEPPNDFEDVEFSPSKEPQTMRPYLPTPIKSNPCSNPRTPLLLASIDNQSSIQVQPPFEDVSNHKLKSNNKLQSNFVDAPLTSQMTASPEHFHTSSLFYKQAQNRKAQFTGNMEQKYLTTMHYHKHPTAELFVSMNKSEDIFERPLDPDSKGADGSHSEGSSVIKVSVVSADSSEAVKMEQRNDPQAQIDLALKADQVMSRMSWLTHLKTLFDYLEQFVSNLKVKHVEKTNFLDALGKIETKLPLQDRDDYLKSCNETGISFRVVNAQFEEHLPEYFTWDNLFDILLFNSVASQFAIDGQLIEAEFEANIAEPLFESQPEFNQPLNCYPTLSHQTTSRPKSISLNSSQDSAEIVDKEDFQDDNDPVSKAEHWSSSHDSCDINEDRENIGNEEVNEDGEMCRCGIVGGGCGKKCVQQVSNVAQIMQEHSRQADIALNSDQKQSQCFQQALEEDQVQSQSIICFNTHLEDFQEPKDVNRVEVVTEDIESKSGKESQKQAEDVNKDFSQTFGLRKSMKQGQHKQLAEQLERHKFSFAAANVNPLTGSSMVRLRASGSSEFDLHGQVSPMEPSSLNHKESIQMSNLTSCEALSQHSQSPSDDCCSDTIHEELSTKEDGHLKLIEPSQCAQQNYNQQDKALIEVVMSQRSPTFLCDQQQETPKLPSLRVNTEENEIRSEVFYKIKSSTIYDKIRNESEVQLSEDPFIYNKGQQLLNFGRNTINTENSRQNSNGNQFSLGKISPDVRYTAIFQNLEEKSPPTFHENQIATPQIKENVIYSFDQANSSSDYAQIPQLQLKEIMIKCEETESRRDDFPENLTEKESKNSSSIQLEQIVNQPTINRFPSDSEKDYQAQEVSKQQEIPNQNIVNFHTPKILSPLLNSPNIDQMDIQVQNSTEPTQKSQKSKNKKEISQQLPTQGLPSASKNQPISQLFEQTCAQAMQHEEKSTEFSQISYDHAAKSLIDLDLQAKFKDSYSHIQAQVNHAVPGIELIQIRALNIAKNQLIKIPTGLGASTKNLFLLNISHNKLKSLNGLEGCHRLIFLNAASNMIQSITTLSHLTKLKELYLSSNQISNGSLKELINLKVLHILDLRRNKLSDSEKFIDAISGNKLSNIFALDLRNNQFFPATQNTSSAQAFQIRESQKLQQQAFIDKLHKNLPKLIYLNQNVQAFSRFNQDKYRATYQNIAFSYQEHLIDKAETAAAEITATGSLVRNKNLGMMAQSKHIRHFSSQTNTAANNDSSIPHSVCVHDKTQNNDIVNSSKQEEMNKGKITGKNSSMRSVNSGVQTSTVKNSRNHSRKQGKFEVGKNRQDGSCGEEQRTLGMMNGVGKTQSSSQMSVKVNLNEKNGSISTSDAVKTMTTPTVRKVNTQVFDYTSGRKSDKIKKIVSERTSFASSKSKNRLNSKYQSTTPLQMTKLQRKQLTTEPSNEPKTLIMLTPRPRSTLQSTSSHHSSTVFRRMSSQTAAKPSLVMAKKSSMPQKLKGKNGYQVLHGQVQSKEDEEDEGQAVKILSAMDGKSSDLLMDRNNFQSNRDSDQHIFMNSVGVTTPKENGCQTKNKTITQLTDSKLREMKMILLGSHAETSSSSPNLINMTTFCHMNRENKHGIGLEKVNKKIICSQHKTTKTNSRYQNMQFSSVKMDEVVEQNKNLGAKFKSAGMTRYTNANMEVDQDESSGILNRDLLSIDSKQHENCTNL